MNPGALQVAICAPWNGRLALSGIIAVWLLPRLLKSGLMGKAITERELYDYIVANEPNHREWFERAGVEMLTT